MLGSALRSNRFFSRHVRATCRSNSSVNSTAMTPNRIAATSAHQLSLLLELLGQSSLPYSTRYEEGALDGDEDRAGALLFSSGRVPFSPSFASPSPPSLIELASTRRVPLQASTQMSAAAKAFADDVKDVEAPDFDGQVLAEVLTEGAVSAL
eukprot:scaffold1163_cov362-Prasinococcus_capsulatus_cf.AAC.4